MKRRILKGSGGLNTESDPARSGYDEDIGIWDLAACSNVDITDRNRISRRKGFTRKLAGASHSLFAVEEKYCLFVVQDALCLLLPSLTEYEVLQTGMAEGARLSVVVLDGKAYWCNGFQKGVVADGVNSEWVKGAVPASSNITRVFNGPPVGRLLAYHNGIMYVITDKVAWHSEPYGPDIYSLGDSFISCESLMQMFRPVSGGIYISDEHATWFLKGDNPKNFTWTQVDNRPALPYSDSPCLGTITPDQAGNPLFSPQGNAQAAVWLTGDGVVYGSPEGTITKITESKIKSVDHHPFLI